MGYEWEERKNRQNQRKYDGISFELATLVFDDADCIVTRDRADALGEQRWHAVGTARIAQDAAAVLLVVHTCREESDGEEIIRIISAREQAIE